MGKYQQSLVYSFAAGAVVLLLCGGGFLIASSPASDCPQIACEKSVFDFGSQRDTYEVDHEFIVENRGRQRLEILDVQKNCSCIMVDMATNVVEPGGVMGIGVNFPLQGRKGKLEQKIVLISNAPAMPQFVLCVKGEVK